MDSDKVDTDLIHELAGLVLKLRKLGRFPDNHDQYKHRQMHFLFSLSKLIQPGEKGVKASDMSDSLHITRGGISQTINELESAGLIERISDPTDRRVVLIAITDAGKKQMDDAFQFLQTKIAKITSFLGEEDTRHLVRILNRMIPYLINPADYSETNSTNLHGA